MIKPVRIAPSILAADFSRLGEEVRAIEAHVDSLHIDVMDGHFVPNISLGIPVIASIRAVTDLEFDCHLMITNPLEYVVPLKEAGADMITVHIEAMPDPTAVADEARNAGLKFGLVINPPTPFEAIDPYVEIADLVLVMSVQPGFGGQAFDGSVLEKVAKARKFIDARGLDTDLQIDGGIATGTVRLARQAGADVFVAGSAVFRAPDPAAAVAELRHLAESGND